jgi:HEAT repeat protein
MLRDRVPDRRRKLARIVSLGVLVCVSLSISRTAQAAKTRGDAEALLRTFAPTSTNEEEAVAIAALVKLGQEAVPALIQALKSTDFHLRLSATLVLERMGPEARESVPALIAELKRPDFDNPDLLRADAAQALAAIGPTPESVAALTETLYEQDDTVAEVSVASRSSGLRRFRR